MKSCLLSWICYVELDVLCSVAFKSDPTWLLWHCGVGLSENLTKWLLLLSELTLLVKATEIHEWPSGGSSIQITNTKKHVGCPPICWVCRVGGVVCSIKLEVFWSLSNVFVSGRHRHWEGRVGRRSTAGWPKQQQALLHTSVLCNDRFCMTLDHPDPPGPTRDQNTNRPLRTTQDAVYPGPPGTTWNHQRQQEKTWFCANNLWLHKTGLCNKHLLIAVTMTQFGIKGRRTGLDWWPTWGTRSRCSEPAPATTILSIWEKLDNCHLVGQGFPFSHEVLELDKVEHSVFIFVKFLETSLNLGRGWSLAHIEKETWTGLRLVKLRSKSFFVTSPSLSLSRAAKAELTWTYVGTLLLGQTRLTSPCWFACWWCPAWRS